MQQRQIRSVVLTKPHALPALPPQPAVLLPPPLICHVSNAKLQRIAPTYAVEEAGCHTDALAAVQRSAE